MSEAFPGAQISLLDEIIVDNFAGGGGASTGIELATGRVVDIAINHDPDAILMHKTNHPHTQHIQASVWDVDPVEVCRGRPVGLAWFSPDCKHFSKAKGGALVDRNIRGLAWIVLRWAARVRPRVIILENVEEFITWGPVRKGKPVKSKAGQTFHKWKTQLINLGYAVEHRELVAADYGAPTIRKRFVLIARCDGKPIVWPERTHAPAESEDARTGICKPWRSAAEVIDWSLPMYSIFDTRKEIKEKYGVDAVRPLADNTQRRVICGVDKHAIKSGNPFLVECNHSGAGHISEMFEPLGTITAKCTKGIVAPMLAPATFSNTGSSVGTPANHPVSTIRASGGEVLSVAFLAQYHSEKTEVARTCGLDGPMLTIDSSNRYALASVNLTEYFGNGAPLNIREPMHTVTSKDREALTSVVLHPVHAGGYKGRGNLPTQPLNTITARGGISLEAAHIVKFKGTNLGQTPAEPLQTITAQSNPYALCRAVIQRYDPAEDVGRWPQVRALLNKYCGYTLGEDEIILLVICGIAFYIRDILLRMLAPKELYAAMGFPLDYIIDRDYLGNEYGKGKQVARCGNAVCPPMAEAVVRANYEASPVTIISMAQFANIVSA